MIFLILGVSIWAGVHFIPSLGASARAGCIARIGEGPYKGLFALSLVGAIVLIVLGWRSTAPTSLYAAPGWGAGVANVGMLVALVFFLGSNVPTNLKRFVRHPQLTGVAFWGASHLLANGDVRSVILFGGFIVWALLEIAFINRRDGAWQKPEPLPLAADLKPLVAGVVGWGVLVFAHPYIAGVAVFAR